MFKLAVLASALLPAAIAAAELKSVVVIGHRSDAQSFLTDVLAPVNIVAGRDGWISPLRYKNFSVVYLGGTVKRLPPTDGWAGDENLAAVRSYLEEGGVIVMSCLSPRFLLEGQPAAADLIGFGGVTRFTDVSGVILAGSDDKLNWCCDKDVLVPVSLLPGTEVLARFVSDKRSDTAVAATMRKVGKGRLYWVQMPYVKLKSRYQREGRPLTLDGAAGEHILSVDGKNLEDFAGFYRNMVLSSPNVRREIIEPGWALEPLGPEGKLETDDTFKNKPEYRPRPKRDATITLVGPGVKVAVTAPREDADAMRLADELAWHLSRMSGEKVEVVSAVPPSGPVISLRRDSTLAQERSIIRREGRVVSLSGEGAGLSHAVTYFLEALGVRYIWPGKSGKVIPKRFPLVMPDITLDYVPDIRARGMRGGDEIGKKAMEGSRTQAGLRRFGIDPEVWRNAFNAARIDREGNRDFFRWHGICDNDDWKGAYTDSRSPWKWGHYFKDFWIRYGKTHPEWFALQMSGSRFQKLGGRPERPTLCLSNKELAKETARRLAEQLDEYPWKKAWTVGLPDGGAMQDCMCPKCRALDPKNSVREDWVFYNPKTAQREKYTYVPITDRYVTFMNRVMAELRVLRPGKELTFYAYNHYTMPPIAVKPDPGLICLSTSGGYKDARGRDGALKNIAKWQRLCPRILWRPNALRGFHQVAVPQNFACMIAGDLECMKVNGLLGTDFDCMANDWAVKGIVYYTVARALLNPDRLSPEDTVADYCESAFGAAAGSVKEYFACLEKGFSAAARTVAANKEKGLYIPDDQTCRLLDAGAITGALDIEKLSALLDRAENQAASDAEVLERVRFLRRGLEHARLEKALCEARKAGGDQYGALRKEYFALIRKTLTESPLAVDVTSLARHNPFMNGYDDRPEK